MADNDDPLKASVEKATGGAPKSPKAAYTYAFSPELVRANDDKNRNAVRAYNDAMERAQAQKEDFQSRGSFRETNQGFAHGGPVLPRAGVRQTKRRK